ncbi:metallophosphoesterase, partial [Bacteroidota bacterium]
TSFKTYMKNQSSFDFVAMGDSRSNPDIFASILDNMQQDEPDLIISMGDLVARGGDMPEWKAYYYDIAKNVIDHIPLVSTLGDHEGGNDDGELFRHFLRIDQPTEKQWFSFDYGDAHFVSLDYRHPDSDEMVNWFINDMSSSDARWKFVYLHRPSYNLGGHRSTWGRDKWPSLFSEYHVDIVFAGHSHIYERFYPMQEQPDPDSWPVTYITTGGAGAGLYDVTQHASLAVAESVNHFVHVEINGKTLKLKAIRKDRSILDELTIIKKGKGHDPAYNALVQSQKGVDLLTSLTSEISIDLDYVPFKDYVSPYVMILKSCVNEDVPFRIELNEISAQSYKMDSFSGVLKAQGESQVTLKIYSINEFITISNRGRMNPELRLNLVYTYGSIEEKIIGKPAVYWPDVY